MGANSANAPSTVTTSLSGLIGGALYYLRVRATNADGSSAYSNVASGTPVVGGPLPNVPTGLSASAVSSTQINLSWTDVTGQGYPPDEDSYVLERATDSGFTQNYARFTPGKDSTSYQNTGLSAGTNYYYRLRSVDSAGWSSPSTVVNATTQSGGSQAPTVATAAAASPATVTGSTTSLSVLGADDMGESALTYTWSVSLNGKPVGAADPTYSINGTNAAKNVTATFTKAGSYTLVVTIRDADNQTVTSSVTVQVTQVASRIEVSSASVVLQNSGTYQFTATAKDQFGDPMASQPPFTWSLGSGGVGTLSASGLYTAPASGTGAAFVRASSGSVTGTAAVTVATLSTRVWDGGGDGSSWGDRFNWSSDTLPGASDTVVLNGPAALSLLLGSGSYAVGHLVDYQATTISGGTLTINAGLELGNSTLTITGSSTYVVFPGTQSISGSGQIVIAQGLYQTAGSQLTIGSGITVRGSGSLGMSPMGPVIDTTINNGVILSESGSGIAVRSSLSNTGQIRATGGTIMFFAGVTNSGTLEANGADIILQSITNTGTLRAVGLSEFQPLGDNPNGPTLGGGAGAISGNEMSVQWRGQSNAPGTTYRSEISTDGGTTWTTFQTGNGTPGTVILTDRQRNTGYMARVTVTDPSGGKQIYESLQTKTLNRPAQKGTRVLLGYVDEEGNWAIQFTPPKRVLSGSAASASYTALTQAGYVTDGTAPIEPGGSIYQHQKTQDGQVQLEEYSFSPKGYLAAGGDALTVDPSSQQSLSILYDVRHKLTPVYGAGDVPPCECCDADAGPDPASGTVSADTPGLGSEGFGEGFGYASAWTSAGTTVFDDANGSGVLEGSFTDSKAADGLVTKYTYDNLGQTTKVQTYVDADGDWVIDTGELRSQQESLSDERGQVYQSVQWEVKPSSNHALKDHLTTNYFYDPRGLLVKTATASGLFSKSSYDGAGRQVASYTSCDTAETSYANALTVTGDTVIEQNRIWYDKAGNPVAQANYRRLETDVSSTGALTAANAYASSSVTWYDLANRPTTSATIGHESGTSTRYVFANNGTLIDTDADGIPDIAEGAVLNPNSSDDYIISKVEYDVAGKAYRQTDNAGHITQTNRNLAGRTTKTIANYVDGNVTETEASDTDQTTEYLYDAQGRLATQRAYNPKGSGHGVEYQDTRYLYGDLTNASLVTSTIYPDSTDTDSTGSDQMKFTYDWLGRKLTSTDQRGVVHTYGYDPVGRLASDAVTTLPTGVDGLVRRVECVYQDDGKVSTITTYDAVTTGNIVNQVKYTYDGWGDTKTEQSHAGAVTAGTPAVIYSYADGADANGNAQYLRQRKVTYPGGRVVYYLYEATPAARLASTSENAGGTQNLASYTYLGMGTIVKESHPQVSGGLNLSYGANGTYAGWDRFGRTLSQEWRKGDGTLVDGYSYTYNRAGDRISQGNELNPSYSETYSYDGLSRLTDTNRNGTDLQAWGLDALGNWSGFTDGALTQTRIHDAANETTGISGTWVDPVYDAAGNMISDPMVGAETTRQFLVYDAWNRLVAVKADNNGQPGSTIATYVYDGRGYRVQKVIAGGDTFDYYQNDSNQAIEVRKNGDTDAYEQYVWDQRYIDAPVMAYRDTNTDGTVDRKLYVTQDANFDVTATVNGDSGAVVDRFVYSPYGQRTVLTLDWALGTSDFLLGHQGLMLDSETGLYYNRARYLHTSLGVFTIRDPIGYVDGANVYEYVGSVPTSETDPTGLFLSHIHFILTLMAFAGSGCPGLDVLTAAAANVAEDWDTNGTDHLDTRRHAMAGMRNGRCQTQQEAEDDWWDWVSNRMDLADGDCDPWALGEALHAAQDRWAGGHGFAPWPGGFPSPSHLLDDAFPTPEEFFGALNDSRALAAEYAANCC